MFTNIRLRTTITRGWAELRGSLAVCSVLYGWFVAFVAGLFVYSNLPREGGGRFDCLIDSRPMIPTNTGYNGLARSS